MSHKKIVVIEKDKILKSILELFIEQLDSEVVASFFNFKNSVDFVKNNEVDILIIDLNSFDNKISLNEYIQFIESLKFPILFLGNSEDIEIAKKMISFNIYSFMSKPISKNILKINIEIACSKHKKIVISEQTNLIENSQIFCFTDAQGNLTDYSTPFSNLFLNRIPEKESKDLQHIFVNNQEFIKYEKFTKSLHINESIKSIFLHHNVVYESLILKIDEKKHKLYFNVAPLEKEFLYRTKYLNARFSNLFENSKENILIFDNQNKLTNYNTAALELFKTINNKELYQGLTFYEVFHTIPKHEIDNIIETVYLPATHTLDRSLVVDSRYFHFKIQVTPIISEEIGSISGYIVTSMDISNETNLKKEIETLKDELKPVYESTIQRFYLTDSSKKLISFNESALKIIQEEFDHTLKKGDNIIKFVPDEVGQEVFETAFQKALKGEHVSYKIKSSNPNGDQWNEIHYEPVININGELNRVLIWTLDITESEKNLIALNESNQRYSLVAKGGNDGLFDWNISTNEVYLSPRWKNLLGYEDDELDNEFGIRDALTHPDDKISSETILNNSLQSDSEMFQNEIRLLCKDQTYKWVLERGIIQRDEKGKPLRIAGSITDITDQKQAEETLLQLNKSLIEERQMFIKGNLVIIRVDAKNLTNVNYISDNSLEITGYSPQEYYDKLVPFKSIIHEDDKYLHIKERETAIRENHSHIDFSDYRITKKDGSIVWIKNFTSIIRDKNGDATYLLGYLIDITKTKATEIEYEDMQGMFTALWQALENEAYIVQKNGRINFSKKEGHLKLNYLLEHEYFVYEQLSCLKNWNEIIDKIEENKTVYTCIHKIENQEYQVKVLKIDNNKFLISTNIPLE